MPTGPEGGETMAENPFWDHIAKGRLGRRRVLRGAVLGATGFTGAALAGCTTSTAPAATSGPATTAPAGASSGATAAPAGAATPAAVQPKRGGTMRYSNSGRPPFLDVHQTATTTLTDSGAGVIYSRLVKMKVGADVPESVITPIGDLAESWQQADDLTYVFKLRPGVKWHNVAPVNGRDLTAEDVVYSFQRQVAERINAALLEGIARFEAPDRATVRITLEKPNADLLVNLADNHNKVVAKEAVEAKGDLKEGPNVGTGPWLFESWNAGDGLAKLTRNPDYFVRGQPYFDRIEFSSIPDEQTRINAFRTAQLEYFALGTTTTADVEALKRDIPGLQVRRTQAINSGVEMGIKADSGVTQDVRVRQAISKALDRRVIIDSVFNGRGWFSPGIRVPGFDWVPPEDEMRRLYARDLAAARRLLTEAGQPAPDLELSVANYGTSYQTTGELIVSQLKEAGFNVRIKQVDPTAYLANVLARGEYQMYIGPTSPRPSANADLLDRFFSTGPRNTSGYKDAALDKMINDQVGMRVEADRKKALLDIQRYILDKAFWFHILTSQSDLLMQPYLRDYYSSGVTEPDRFALAWLDK
jgi:peptide/nickel transport system substrate-binding protein